MAGAVLLASGPVLAQPANVLPTAFAAAQVSGETRPVPAWLRFCEAQPSECQVDTAEPETVKLTRQVWQQMIAVNAKVNGSIRPLTDDDHWGVADSWGYPTDGYGDCEDYQLLKRKLLAEGGLPRRAMRMTVVIDEKGEGHAVLMIRTDRGDFILDNKSSSILPWYQTGYIFVKREGQDGSTWASLGGVMSPTTTANR
ncbi:MAG TPA: transglutaminase-like cysteine peptidase [Microvirga sp.]